MKEVVVLSGKGGTGKTSIVGSLAALAENKVTVDCDVDAADLHLLLQPEIRSENEFWSGQTAVIDESKCTGCGLCEQLCRFSAIHDFMIDSASCEGCGFCSHICPVEAITMEDNLAGKWFISDTRFGPLVHARLGIAQENSGKLVAEVRQQAQKLTEERDIDLIISDGPPGIGCPVISSLSGTDLALLVTEPTLSGQHDLERVIEVCHHFRIPALVCINKCDINEGNTRRIREYCRGEGLEIVGEIPYDSKVTEAMIRGKTVVEFCSNGPARRIKQMWQKISNHLADGNRGGNI
jgi:MinD superfamily P-loop ATPase